MISKIISRNVFVILPIAFFNLIFIFIISFSVWSNIEFYKFAERGQGIAIDRRTVEFTSQYGEKFYAHVIFLPENNDDFRPGDKVSLIYDPYNLSDIHIDSWNGVWGYVWGGVLVYLIFFSPFNLFLLYTIVSEVKAIRREGNPRRMNARNHSKGRKR